MELCIAFSGTLLYTASFIDEQNQNWFKSFSVPTNSQCFDKDLYGGSWMWFIWSNFCHHLIKWFSEGKKDKSQEKSKLQKREHKPRPETMVDESTS